MGFTTDWSRQRDSKPSVMIVADDLSGATDSAVACAERGLDTVVVLGETSDPWHCGSNRIRRRHAPTDQRGSSG